jgi:hypothetical protein
MTRIIIFVLFNIALIIAQVFITQGKHWKYGLAIPIFNSVLALMVALMTSPFSVSTITFINGVRVVRDALRFGGFIWQFTWTLLLLMIPAGINFILYFTARNRNLKKEAENIDKMKINDLE